MTRSALRMRETRLGRASMRCGSCIGVVAANTETLSPPSSCASAAHSGSQAKTFTAAVTGTAAAPMAKAKSILKSLSMFVASELVRAVRAQAHDVLEEHLRVGQSHARVVACELQPDAAELARVPVDHDAVLLRLVGGEDREVRGGPHARIHQPDTGAAGAQLIEAISCAPLRQELVDALRIPPRLSRRQAVGERRTRGVEREAAVLLAMEVLALQLEIVVRGITVRRPLEYAVDHPQPARAAEAVGDRAAGRVHIVVAPVARVGAQVRQAGLPRNAVADVAANVREEIERGGAVLSAAAETCGECATATELRPEIPVQRGRRDPAELNAVFVELSAEERFHCERLIGEVPGMRVDLVLIAQRREKALGLDGEPVRQADGLDVALFDADRVVVRRDRPDQGAAEVVVDIRHERQLG